MRILFIAFPGHPHSARWISQVNGLMWDIHLLPSTNDIVHEDFRNITVHHAVRWRTPSHDGSIRFAGADKLTLLVQKIMRKGLRVLGRPPVTESRAEALAKVIRRIKPDIVHSMEIQHAGYLTLEARQLLRGDFPHWIVSNWGSDIYLFGEQPEHRDKIRAVLQHCNSYTCECVRDVELAKDLGFHGTVEPVLPVGGGFDVGGMQKFRQPGPTSSRRLILLKGYHNWAGRALYALEAIKACAEDLQGFRVVTFLTDPVVAEAAERISRETGIPISVAPRTPREGMFRLFGGARIYIGLSISDGISTSMLEAMIMGAFPIQSCTACANEWIESGKTGLIVPPEDQETITAALRQAIRNDALVDQAAEQNIEVSFERLDLEVIRPQVIEMYKRAIPARTRTFRVLTQRRRAGSTR